MAATQREILPHQPHHVKVELSRGGGGLPTSREVKSARVKLETWKWLKKQPLQLEVFSPDTRTEAEGGVETVTSWDRC